MSKASTFLGILQGVAPIALMLIPGKAGQIARSVAPSIVQGIVEAQQIPGATNAQKKEHALRIVEAGQAATAAAGVEIPRDELMSAASSAIDTVIDTAHVVAGTHKAVSAPTN